MSVYLHLFHGRDDPEQDMDDWGFDGPVIGPLKYVHVTYMTDLKMDMEQDVAAKFFPELIEQHEEMLGRNVVPTFCGEHHLYLTEDLVVYDGKYYGDWSVSTSPTG